MEKHTGHLPGGVSPFGTRTALPVYVEETILTLDRVYINGPWRRPRPLWAVRATTS